MVVRRIGAGEEKLVQLCVREVYEEYGFTWEEDGYHADLYQPDTSYPFPGGFWIALDREGDVCGCCALKVFSETVVGSPLAGEELLCVLNGKVRVLGADCELNRLYVRPHARKNGAGSSLTQAVIDAARLQGMSRMEIWSDKLFEDAHRLYVRFGACLVGQRVCDDPDESPEWGFVIDLS